MKNILFAVIFTASLAGCTTGCLVDSIPQGARVSVDGSPSGKTPCMVQLGESGFVQSHDVSLTLDGYQPESMHVGRSTAVLGNFPTALPVFRLDPVAKK